MNRAFEPPRLRALIFDVDGTLADTEQCHRLAFNAAFSEAGLAWEWDVPTYTRLLEVAGGKERMRHHISASADPLAELPATELDAIIDRLHADKTAAYGALVSAGALQLRPGVADLIDTAHRAGLALAIATTTTPANIDTLLAGTLGSGWRQLFAVIEDASTAVRKKPDPQAYQQALARLGLKAAECLAFEDSQNGLRAAHAAGIATVITANEFTLHHDFTAATRVLPDLSGLTLDELLDWHTGATQPQHRASISH